jgi:predicted lipoprotein with Yx(FWY)xxD motif
MKKWYSLGITILVVLLVGISVASAQDTMQPTVKMGGNDTLGSFLVGANGMTLYLYTKDVPGTSNCYDQCATNWPPLLVAEGETPTLDAGIPGMLGVTERTDSTYQVTYNGWPLYYWVKDMAAGDATGQNVGEVWFVVTPPTVSLGGNADLGDFLVGPNGMTLYLYTKDTPGTSNCYDQCATNWPPLLVADGVTPSLQPGVPGTLGVTERTDSTYQVTYNDMPLYYWVKDMAAGDATGQNVGEVWFILKPPTLSVAHNDALGDFLIGPNGMTLYLYTKDEADVTNCYDKCAVAWPPLLVAPGETPTASADAMGTLNVITRTDGGMQVTYNGKPLYYWVKDHVPGDTTGQNVGEVWFVLAP